MFLHMADVAPNGELKTESVFDTSTFEDPLLFFFGQVVAKPGPLVCSMECAFTPDGPKRTLDFLWLRDGDNATATMVVDDRRTLSFCAITSPYDRKNQPRPLWALQRAIVEELHGTSREPAFAIRSLASRPLVVTVDWNTAFGSTIGKIRHIAKVAVAAFAGLDTVKAAVAALELD